MVWRQGSTTSYKVNAAGDIVTEVDSEGIDTVQSSVSYRFGERG